MSDHEHYEEHDPSVHHEESDVNVRAILVFSAWFVGGFVLCAIALVFLFNAFRDYEARKDRAPISEVAGAQNRQYPPAPRLQPFPEPGMVGLVGTDRARISSEATELSSPPVSDPYRGTPVIDMVELQKQYKSELETYGFVDRAQGTMRIPISEAKKRLLAQGLPTRTSMAAVAPSQAANPAAPMSATTVQTQQSATQQPDSAAAAVQQQ